MNRIANKAARSMVQNLTPFEGSNLFARFNTNADEEWYVVYSYGEHHPLFIHANGAWFENEDRVSPTTSKHRTQSHPLPKSPTVLLSTAWMRALAEGGFTAIAKERILRG
jgi:hypothetical protein